jgi:DNA-directed RNA polymerase beta subunit
LFNTWKKFVPLPIDTKEVTAIFSSPDIINTGKDEVLVEGLTKQFPIETRNYRLEVSNVHAEPKHFSQLDQKEAILKSKSLTYPIRGDLKLYDKHTGTLLDQEKNFSLMDSFGFTGKHTMLYKGNNYSVSNMLQLRPGAYTRRRPTGVLETHVNTGKGQSFYITLDPEKMLFNLNIKSSYVPIAPLLTKVFGVGPKEASQYIPSTLWENNLKAVAGKETKILSSMYGRMVNRSLQKPNPSIEEMIVELKNALQNSELAPQTTEVTLGKGFTHITGETLLLAMKNLVDVHSGKRPEDNRDSLQFKKVQSLPDFLRTRFEKNQIVKNLTSKMGFQLEKLDKENPKIRSVLAPKPFNKFFSNYILDSHLVSTLSETNPLESIESVGKVTVMGPDEGGIGSEDGVPLTARDIDPSHLGIIDPNRTPESSSAGIDQRFTLSSGRDKQGNLYARVRDKQGKQLWLSVGEMMSHTIGFPNQETQKRVQAQVKGELKEVDAKDVDYWLSDATNMYTITTNMVPFLNSNHPGRLTMASKSLTQALSLVDREAPYVQTTNRIGIPYVKFVGNIIGLPSPTAGEVTKITDNEIHVKEVSGKTRKLELPRNLPFNMKGFFDYDKPLVKVGDHIHEGQSLADSNYSQNGSLALGKNLTVAYMPYKGYNHEDGLVISQACADGLKSHHAYRVDYSVSDISTMKKPLLNRYFPGKFTKEQLANLDDKGFAKVGSILHHGDPVYAVLEKREATPEEQMLGRLHKSLIAPYRCVVEYWQHDEDGRVVDAHTEGKDLRLILRSIKPLEIGDKLTGLHGNKGIVSLILPNDEMPYNAKTGKPADILLNPASVTSRINLGQLMETAAGKIAEATGKPYYVHNFSKKSNVSELKQELADHGLEDAEEMIDPITKKSLGKILTGPQYFLKLYKTTDQNWSARNTGSYDNVKQPTKGGEEGSKAVGYMEMLGLLGSDARKNLKEMATLKSEENSQYWAKFRTGQPLPKPNSTFATQKFFDYLKGSGIDTRIKDGKITAAPLTNDEILKMSNGVLKEGTMLTPRGLEPAKGGLFDTSLTGGIRGTRWTHYDLAEPIANPSFERPIRTLLGINKNEFNDIAYGNLGVKKVKPGVFEVHDTKTGKLVKTLNLSSAANLAEEEEEEPELRQIDSEDSLDIEHVV